MALNIPKVVQSLFVQNTDASRVRDNLATAVQPVLDFLNQYMQPNPDGSLTIRGAVAMGAASMASAAIQGAVSVAGPLAVNGSLIVRLPNGQSLCVVPGGAGAAFYTTNYDNSAAMMTIDEIGNIWSRNAITATNIVSGAGFRASIYMGGYWTTTYAANYMGACMHPVRNQSNGTLGETPSQRVMSWPGSVLAILVNQAGSIGGTTLVQVYKNYQPWIPLTSVGSGAGPYAPLSFAKGRYTFARSDVLTVYLTTTASGNTQLTCNLDVEYGA